MAWTRTKTAIATGAAVVLVVGTTAPFIVHHFRANTPYFLSSSKELSDADDTKYQKLAGMTPEQAARAIFEACESEDWQNLAAFWPPGDSSLNDYKNYGGLQIVSLGKPFKARISIAKLIAMQPNLRNQFKSTTGDFEASSVFVPYEMRLKNGTIRKWQLSIRCDNPEHRWYYDGGM